MTKPLTGKSSALKHINAALVKDALRVCGTATRRELSEVTQLSQPTVNTIINMLRANNEVVCRGTASSSGGRCAELYALNHQSLYVVAVFAMPERLDFAVTNGNDEIIVQGSAPVLVDADYCGQIADLVRRLQSDYCNIRVVGVAVPSAVGEGGGLYAVPQIQHLERKDLRKALEEQLQIPVVVENDVNVRALGYYRSQLAFKTNDMAYLHLSTGLGAGLIINGHIYNGANHFSGEVSYLFAGTEYCGGALEKAVTNTDDPELQALLLARIALGLICIINPPFLVMGGSRIHPQLIERVREICMKELPREVAKEFLYAADETTYLYRGISHLAQEHVDSTLRIVRAGGD